jgi:hypothetical protein
MTESQPEQPSTAIVAMSVQQMLRIILVGAGVGVITWGLTLLLDTYVFKAIVCQDAASVQCASSFEYSTISASILAGGLGLLGLVKLRIFRALLVVLAATVSLWGVELVMRPWEWQIALPVSLLLFMVAYCLFAWIARLRSFVMTLVVLAILVVAVRLVLNL